MSRLGNLEIFLIEFTGYFLFWLYDEYLATLLSIIFGSICFFLLLFALISEKLEPTKVPRQYFSAMVISVIAPIAAAGVYFLFTQIL